MVTLYHYIHCPFCLRVRMGLGYLNIKYESIVLPYSDEETPIKLCQKKQLPILKNEQGEYLNESLGIIKSLDSGQRLGSYEELDSFNTYLTKLGGPIHSMVMPYFVFTAEFSEKDRQYFKKKKEAKRGPFSELLIEQKRFKSEVAASLLPIEQHLMPYYKSEKLTIFDVMLASHLWGLYIVPEFQFTSTMHDYLQNVGEITNFNYHSDLGNFF